MREGDKDSVKHPPLDSGEVNSRKSEGHRKEEIGEEGSRPEGRVNREGQSSLREGGGDKISEQIQAPSPSLRHPPQRGGG